MLIGGAHLEGERHVAWNFVSSSKEPIESAKRAKLPEDEMKRLEKDIQTATDKTIADINSHLAHKEKDLLNI